MSGRRGSAQEEELGRLCCHTLQPALEGNSSPAQFCLTLKVCPGNISLQKHSLLHFTHEEQRQHIQAGICLKLGFIPIFHLERYLHVCLTKCGITHLIKISGMLKLLDELGH